MNKIIILAGLGFFTQIQSQELQKTMIPKITNEFEKITIQNSKKKDDDRCIETPEGRKEIFSASEGGYRLSTYYENSFYKSDKFYYKNGYIKNKSLSFNMGSPVGILYHFDKSGKVVKEENTDEDYDFKPENIIAYCKKNKIDLPKGYHDSGYQTRVLKQDFEGKKVWRISHQIAGDKIEEIILDGKTGKELQKKTVPFYNP
ncbi:MULTISPECIES: hypothetical protein [unclassified Chryseobacterium]|uniref:hypothetical protein n=1 Tax=unclassified Chryseobacterium TaxID=2593645 RepID=UPI000D75D9F8|nr:MULTISPECIES: hypothetical protein [unclassified Chryseobacterium]PXW12669.1 hypothetical protein C8D70_111140 [Chryseobacterium sp. CBTAP 102]